VIAMKKQPLLTANEVIELLEKEALPDDEGLRNTFKEIVSYSKLVFGLCNNPSAEIPLLQHCANFLQSRGLFVYLKFSKSYPRGFPIFTFLVGECGRLYEKLSWQADYLKDLSHFVETHEHELSPDMIAEKEKIDAYETKIVEDILIGLEENYKKGDKVALEFWCDEGKKLAEEVDAYLERIIDLRRLHAISLIL
jgi:hypothetical protein